MTDEGKWRAYVLSYPVEVDEARVAEELELIRADLKHRMAYEQMGGGGMHIFPDAELDEQADEIMEAAIFEAKESLVLRAIIAERGIEATTEELLAEAQDMAEREATTLEMLARFFGEDFSGLSGDVCRRKAIEWACAQDG